MLRNIPSLLRTASITSSTSSLSDISIAWTGADDDEDGWAADVPATQALLPEAVELLGVGTMFAALTERQIHNVTFTMSHSHTHNTIQYNNTINQI